MKTAGNPDLAGEMVAAGWGGKHSGWNDGRHSVPIGPHSHAAAVRQTMCFFPLLEQGRLVSPTALRTMRDIFASPDIPPDQQKFVRGLASRPVEIKWKWGGWQRDDVIVIGPGRHFLLAALMQHAHGDDYPVVLAPAVNDLMIAEASSR